MNVLSLPLVDHCLEGGGSDKTASRPLLPISARPFLYVLSCREAFLLIFKLSSETVAVYVVVEHPWEGVSSESSYSTVLIPTLTRGKFFEGEDRQTKSEFWSND